MLWQDPVPAVDHELIGERDIAAFSRGRSSIRVFPFRNWSRPPGLPRPRSADQRQTRGSERRPHSPRAPQKDWEVNEAGKQLAKVLQTLEQDPNRASTTRSPAGRKSRSPT